MFRKSNKKPTCELLSPMQGRIVRTQEVGDPVFSGGMLGEGFAVIPEDGLQNVRMPTDGRIVSVSDTCHAVNILTDDGLELLIHVGIDTVELRGEGFELLCSVGDKLRRGDEVMTVDTSELKRRGKDTVTPVIITNPEVLSSMEVRVGRCDVGSVALTYVRGEATGK